MKKKYPLIHLVWIEEQSIGGVYDGHSNIFIALNKEKYNLIYKLINSRSNDSAQIFRNLKDFTDLGLLDKNIRRNRINNDDDFIDGIIDYTEEKVHPRKLTLELTQDCNLRCKYCRYTINEKEKTGRFHNTSKIDKDTAQQAINKYLLEYSQIKCKIPEELRIKFEKKNPPTVSFYGGEVLLNKPLIKELIIKGTMMSKTLGLKVRYVVTTNGTLLDEDIIDFFVKNKVFLAFSLDGPKKENDKNRVFPDGSGSFNHVEKWISFIDNKYPKYIRNMVSIQAVDAPNYDKKAVLQYFRNKTLGNYFAGVNNVLLLPFTDFSDQTETNKVNINEYQEIADNLFRNYILFFESIGKETGYRLIINKIKYNPTIKDMLKLAIEMDRKIAYQPQVIPNYFNSCYMGRTNLLLSTNGNYHICERTDYSLPIGNITDGINNKIIHSMYKNYFTIMNSEKCRSCWAGLFCNICIAQLVKDGKIINPDDNRCEQIRINSDLHLRVLILLSHRFKNIYKAVNKYFHKVDNTSIDDFLNEYQIS